MGRGQSDIGTATGAVRRGWMGQSFESAAGLEDGEFGPADVPVLKIQFDEDGYRSIGQFIVGAHEKERIDVVRGALVSGERALVFYGPEGVGKSALAEQVAAVSKLGYVKLDSAGVDPAHVRDVTITVGGNSYDARLTREQCEQLNRGLKYRALVHVALEQPELQAAIAQAFRSGGDHRLDISLPSGEDGYDGLHTSVPVQEDGVVIFEVTDDRQTDSPCLSPEAASATTPIYFDRVSPAVEEGINAGAPPYVTEFGDPGTGTITSLDDYSSQESAEKAVAEVRAVVDAIDPPRVLNGQVMSRRKALVKQLQESFAEAARPTSASSGSLAFMDSWLEKVEIQAYDGDYRADRTLAIALEPFLPAEKRGSSPLSTFFSSGNNIPELREWSEAVFNAGARRRGENEILYADLPRDSTLPLG